MNTEGFVKGSNVCRDSEGRRKRVASGAMWFCATNPALPRRSARVLCLPVARLAAVFRRSSSSWGALAALRDLSGGMGDRLFERAVIVAALFFSRQAAKPPRRWGVADDRRDAELGWASRSDGDGLDVPNARASAELLAALRLCAPQGPPRLASPPR